MVSVECFFNFHTKWLKPVFFSCEGFQNSSAYCWWKKSCASWYGKCPIIYKALYIPGGCLGFLNHQQYYSILWNSRVKLTPWEAKGTPPMPHTPRNSQPEVSMGGPLRFPWQEFSRVNSAGHHVFIICNMLHVAWWHKFYRFCCLVDHDGLIGKRTLLWCARGMGSLVQVIPSVKQL